MTEGNIVYLSFENAKAIHGGHDVLACSACKNKTYIARDDLGKWPELYCACCGSRIGSFGWTEQEGSKNG